MPAIPWTTFIDADPEQEYLVMASRLPLQSFLYIPTFLRLTLAVRRQLARTEGLVGYALNAELTKKTFWTVSVWVDDEHLGRFARAMPHVDVIRQLRPHIAPTTFTTWTARGNELPVTWHDAMRRLRAAEAKAADGDHGTVSGAPVAS